MNALDIRMQERDIGHSKPSGYCSWFFSSWFRLSLASVVFLSTVTGLATGAPETYILGQIALALCTFIALSFLADRPLINPIQTFVFACYWWFGVAPAVVSFWYLLCDLSKDALETQANGMEALWIVAPGLLIYGMVAKGAVRWFSGTGIYARFLLPSSANYRQDVLIIYVVLTFCSSMLLSTLSFLGIVGLEETSMFGGTRTLIWWVGVIAAIDAITPMLSSFFMTAFAAPWKTIPYGIKIMIAITIAQTVFNALFSGWKGPLAMLATYYVFAYMRRMQRPPWMLLLTGALLFVLVITPYVVYGRWMAATASAAGSMERTQAFAALLAGDPLVFLPNSTKDVDVRVFFRGISPLAGELTRRNSFLEGEWGGDTIGWGFEVLVPRVLLPEKRDMNIGNFFARTVGADLGVSERFDYLNNIAISIPFEFVGNYGWLGGVLSFGMIAIFWSLLNCWLLTPEHLSDHPLTPFMATFTLLMEAPLGHFLAQVRGLIIPLLIFYFINKVVLRGKI
jgi:hypothetical protein